MCASKSNPRPPPQADDSLRERLQHILLQEDWLRYRTQVKNLAAAFNLEILDCAAALACLAASEHPTVPSSGRRPAIVPELKMVRYRVELGRKHQITEDGLKKLLIEESGVDKRLIGKIEIFYDHTLLQLPDGMPGEIYQHLKSVVLNRQPLRIKRLDGNAHEFVKNTKSARRSRHQPPRGPKEQTPRQSKTDVTPRKKD
ncbi:MAG: DbpA RNA binding domain-containing protein [Gammaproteobacteria bacterium]